MKNKKIILSILLMSSLYADDSFDFDSIETESISAYELKNNISVGSSDNNVVPLNKNDFIKDSNESGIIDSSSEDVILEEADSIFGTSDDIEILIPNVNDSKEVKEPLKKYSNIKYVEGYDWFSILEQSEELFNAELFKRNWSNEYFQEILNERQNISDHIFMSAIYYDYVKKEPEIAENFYLKFRNYFNKDRALKIYLIDYLIRTGRYKHMEDSIITKKDIFAFWGCKGASYSYYKGVLEYLNTKEKSNFYIKKAADCGISKAKEFLK